MNNDILVFDIETIPAPVNDDESFQEIMKRVNANEKIKTPEEREWYELLIRATTPFFGQIICIGLYYETTNGKSDSKTLIGDEKDILTNFWNILAKCKNPIFVSFNGLAFDVPFILQRSMKYKILPTNNNFLNQKRYSTYPHFDVKAVLGNWDKYGGGSLKVVCEFLGIASPKEGDIKADGVYDAYLNGQINDIAEYCLRDVFATYKVYNVLKDYTFKFIN